MSEPLSASEIQALPEIVVSAKVWLMKPEDFQAYEASLWRAFIRDRADYIVLDSNISGQRFVAAGVAWGIDNGLLRHDRTDSSDEQCEVYTFRLTDEGKKRLEANGPQLKDVR